MQEELVFAAAALRRYSLIALAVTLVARAVPRLGEQLDRSVLRSLLCLRKPRYMAFAVLDLVYFFGSARLLCRCFPAARGGYASSAVCAVAMSHHVLLARLPLVAAVSGVASGAIDVTLLRTSPILLWSIHHFFTAGLSRVTRHCWRRYQGRHERRLWSSVTDEAHAVLWSWSACKMVHLVASRTYLPVSAVAPVALLAGVLWSGVCSRSFPQKREDAPVDRAAIIREEGLEDLPAIHITRFEELARVVVGAQRVRHSARAAALRFLAAVEALKDTAAVYLPSAVERALTHTTYGGVATSVPEGTPLFPTSSCPICLDDFQPADEVAVVRCGHVIHAPCMRTWLLSRKTECPVCRADVRGDSPTEDAVRNVHDALGVKLAQWAEAKLPWRIERSAWSIATDFLCLRGYVDRRVLQQLPPGLVIARHSSWAEGLLWAVFTAAGVAPRATFLL